MTEKLVWGMLGGLVIGAGFGYVGGNTGIGIAICMAAGAVAAGAWHFIGARAAGRKARDPIDPD